MIAYFVLICISLVMNDVECLFIYLVIICLSSWKNVYSGPSFIYIYRYIFFFAGPHLCNMEVPRLGVELELHPHGI